VRIHYFRPPEPAWMDDEKCFVGIDLARAISKCFSAGKQVEILELGGARILSPVASFVSTCNAHLVNSVKVGSRLRYVVGDYFFDSGIIEKVKLMYLVRIRVLAEAGLYQLNYK